MELALYEVDRRRKLQLEYNEKHGITPTGIHKNIRERILPKEEEDLSTTDQKISKAHSALGKDIEVMTANYRTMPNKDRKEVLDLLNKEMKREAMELNFERAIEIRDLIRNLKKSV